jgi:hypothetical protein
MRQVMVAAWLSLCLPACAVDSPLDETDSVDDELRSANGLDQGALLAARSSLISLAGGPLTPARIISSGMMSTTAGRALAPYVVKCALPGTSTMLVTSGKSVLGYAGEDGLAPEWATDSCDADCKGWMSACLIAHVNALGVTVPMSMRGPDPALAADYSERKVYPWAEAAFYGDLFGTTPKLYGCTTLGITTALLHERLCGLGLTCSIQLSGVCGLPLGLGACDSVSDGYFQDCRPLLNGLFGGGQVYPQVITTYLSTEGLELLYGLTSLTSKHP